MQQDETKGDGCPEGRQSFHEANCLPQAWARHLKHSCHVAAAAYMMLLHTQLLNGQHNR